MPHHVTTNLRAVGQLSQAMILSHRGQKGSTDLHEHPTVEGATLVHEGEMTSGQLISFVLYTASSLQLGQFVKLIRMKHHVTLQ